MSQDYTVNSYAADHVGQVNLANIEKNLECLRSFFSGDAAPSNTLKGHVWFDSTQNLPKIRNNANSAWLAILTGTTSQKLWIYRNDTDDGWAIDSGVTDRVLALKGGSDLYNANGGTNAGETWANLKAHVHTGSAHTHSHNHQWYSAQGANDSDKTYNSGGSSTNLTSDSTKSSSYVHIARSISTGDVPLGDSYSKTDATAASSANTGAQSTSDVRPAAAVGTLQYPDI